MWGDIIHSFRTSELSYTTFKQLPVHWRDYMRKSGIGLGMHVSCDPQINRCQGQQSEWVLYLLLFLNVRYVILLCSPLFPQMFLAVGSACELSPSLQLAIANHTFIHFKFQYWNWGAEVIYKRSDEDFHTLSIFWEHCPINLHHSMSSWCPFLNTDHAIYHLNINVQLRRVTHLSRKRKKAHTT